MNKAEKAKLQAIARGVQLIQMKLQDAPTQPQLTGSELGNRVPLSLYASRLVAEISEMVK